MDLSPPPPSSSSSSSSIHFPSLHSSSNSFPVIAIALIGILATAILLVSYYIFVIKCCLNWHRIEFLNRFFSRSRIPNPDTYSSPDGNNNNIQKGLDEAIIRSIPTIKFRKLATMEERRENNTRNQSESADSYECSVCLSEFEEGERLRVIPNCCHAFHIDCIDVWLQSNANCPLCRSAISPSSILYNGQISVFPPQRSDNFSGDEEDYVVIEIQGNNLDEPRLVSTKSTSISPNPNPNPNPNPKARKLEHVCSMGDEWIDVREKDEQFRIQPIRRSVSMDLSCDREFCLEIQGISSLQCNTTRQESEISCSSSTSIGDCNGTNNKVRRSIFSFGHGRGYRGSVQPVHLDP